MDGTSSQKRGVIDLEEMKKALSAPQKDVPTPTPSIKSVSSKTYNPIRTFQQDLDRVQGKAPTKPAIGFNSFEKNVMAEPKEIIGMEEFAPIRPSINPYAGSTREFIEKAIDTETNAENTATAEALQAQKPPATTTTPKERPRISTIHTYKDDVADSVKNGATITSIAAAENARNVSRSSAPDLTGSTEENTSHLTRNILLIILSLVILGAGITGVWIAAKTYFVEKNIQAVELQKDITQAEKINEVLARGEGDILGEQLRTLTKESSVPLSAVERDILVTDKEAVAADGTKTAIPVTTESFLARLGVSAPATLIRSLEPDFYFGIHGIHDNQPFLIFHVNSFGSALAGMLTWEPNMIRDLQTIFLRDEDQVRPPLYTIKNTANKYSFEDAILLNKEIRAVRNLRGDVIFLYTFIDTKTLLITGDEGTLKEISTRLIKAQFVR